MNSVEKRGTTIGRSTSCAEWSLLFCLFFLTTLSAYDNHSVGALLPSLQQDFNTTDSSVATVKTCNAFAHGISLGAMWIYGDFIPKRPALFLSIAVWVLISFASLLVDVNHFWIFVALRALAALSAEVFRLLVPVLQAERFEGKMLTRSIITNVLGEILATVLAPSINSLFVSSGTDWRIGLAIAPAVAIPLAFLTTFVLKAKSSSISRSKSIASNAFVMLKRKSYILMILAQSLCLFFALSYMFWLPTFSLHAYDAFPGTFSNLSYPTIMSLMANGLFFGTLVGLPVFAYLSQRLESGTGIFSYFSSNSLAMPILASIGAFIETFSLLAQMIMISSTVPVTIMAALIQGAGNAGLTAISQQMLINVCPAHHYTSGLAFLRLITALVGIPASQIIGLLSDFFRGDESSPISRFYALQKALLCMWIVAVLSACFYALIIRYYKEDVTKARESEKRHLLQSTPLISRKSTVISIVA